MKEVFVDVKGYEDYQVSNLGNIKSLKSKKEKVLKPGVSSSRYLTVALSKEKTPKTFQVHQLVAMAFLNHIPCGMKFVVNHIDFNPLNNNVNNLEVITQRENTNKKHIKGSSRYIGVSWCKRDKKWRSDIWINGKLKYLGLFNGELDASEAYKVALKEIIK
tara:strand:- start:95 stop:577 length:483 start_codon:yes stop_codon:yes gene_type:complete